MTEILHLDISDNDGIHQQQQTHLRNNEIVINCECCSYDPVDVFRENTERETEEEVSVLAVLVSLFRKSLIIGCKSEGFNRCSSMEIGVPTNVRHVAHVTFDRFNGFLGLPVEFEPDVPRRPPSASTSVFGVSTDTMHLSFDTRGNSVPTILLMMQNRLYSQGGLQAEGIFRINGENGQEEQIREQLNRGEVAEDIDVHCLAGLIKAWFRELPHGILDSLEPEQVIQAQSEEECSRLINLLPQTEGALLDWAVNLMADVAQLENYNKMNARNIAMVFAPNMTQMDDPLTALMYAVQVMNFLKTLIVKTLRERQDSILDPGPTPNLEPFDQNGSHSQPAVKQVKDDDDAGDGGSGRVDPDKENGASCRIRSGDGSNCMVVKKGSRKSNERAVARAGGQLGKSSTGSTIVSRLNMRMERIEAWR